MLGSEVLLVLGLVVLSGLALGGAALASKTESARLRLPLAQLAELLGLAPPQLGSNRIEGEIGGVHLHIAGHIASDDQPDYVDVQVRPHRPLPRRTRMTAEGMLPAFDFKTGDADFDKKVKLAGDPDALLGLLGAEVRRDVLVCARLRAFRLDERGISVQIPGLSNDPEAVATRLSRVVRLAGRLDALPPTTEDRLLANVRSDPLPAVRRDSAWQLDQGFRGTDAAIALPPLLMADPEPELRLLGAGMAPKLPLARPILEAALADPEPAARLQAVQGLHELGAEVAGPLVAPAADEANVSVARAIVGVLGEWESPQVEQALITILGHPSGEVRAEAAQALGRRGSIAAVEALLGAARGVAKKAAREAIDAIQGRAGPAERGRLAMTDDAAGRLSDVTWGEGALSEPEDG